MIPAAMTPATTVSAAASTAGKADQRPQRRGQGSQAHGDGHRQTHGSFAANEGTPQVIAIYLGLGATQGDGASVGQDNGDGQHVAVVDAVGQTMRATGIVGHVAADRQAG